MDLSSKSGFTLKPNWQKIEKNFSLNKKDFIKKIKEKLAKINENEVKSDLIVFIEDKKYLTNFLASFKKFILNRIDFVV